MRPKIQARHWVLASAMATLVTGVAGLPARAAELDLETTIAAAPSTADPGQVATYTVEYANHGATAPADPRLRLLLPPGCFLDWTPAEIAAVESTFTDNRGNVVDVRKDTDTCDNMLVSVEGAGGGAPSIPAGATGRFSVNIPLPATIPTVGVFRVESPQELARMYDIARGACGNCDDPTSCFGGPLSSKPAVTADLEVVVDPEPGAGQTPSMGCHALAGFTAGDIALVRRGGCGFGEKALYAQQAGAVGVVIVDDAAHEDENLHSIALVGGEQVAQVTVPVVMIGYRAGEALIAQVGGAERVIATLGGVESEKLPFIATVFHAFNSGDSDPDASNDVATRVTTVSYLGDQAPQAAFSYSPTTPVKGQTVRFADTSSNEPTSWSWDFGDGEGTSSEQNPVYSWAAPGTYTVTLTATNDFGSGSVSHDVAVAGVIQARHETYVAAAAFAEGYKGAFFVTDLEVNNRGLTPMLYQLAWLPRRADNSSPTLSEAFMLAPGHGVRYSNVLDSVFGLSDAVGAVAVLADTANALVMSRTYSQVTGDSPSTFGQSMPGVAADGMITTGQRRRILFLTENQDYRANLGCQNGTASPVTVSAQLFSSDGALLATRSLDLKPRSNDQLNGLFAPYAPLADGYVDVWTETPDAAFFCYGSLADNTSNDPTTVLPQ